MLVSFDFNLIFLKRVKVAGTSIEMFLQNACGLGDARREKTHTLISEKGIVGRRLIRQNRCMIVDDLLWYNHMPALNLRNQLGIDIWQQFLKITSVRNPFDQMVSLFHWSRRKTASGSEDFGHLRQEFSSFILGHPLAEDDPHMTINGVEIIDRYIKFESLDDDLRAICTDLGIPFDASALPHTKSMAKSRKSTPVSAYYTKPTIAHVLKQYPLVFERFSYARQPAD